MQLGAKELSGLRSVAIMSPLNGSNHRNPLHRKEDGMSSRNWFWAQGYKDGLEGRTPSPPDEAKHPWQRSDYFDGHDAGQEDLYSEEENS